jgi:hypothetical protein
MIQRLFLNRIHAETAGAPVRGQDDPILPAFAHEAQALLPFLKGAKPRTEVALDPAVIQLVPVLGGKSGWEIHRVVSEVSATTCNLSIDIASLGDGSQAFGRGGEQPPSMTVALRRQMTNVQ